MKFVICFYQPINEIRERPGAEIRDLFQGLIKKQFPCQLKKIAIFPRPIHVIRDYFSAPNWRNLGFFSTSIDYIWELPIAKIRDLFQWPGDEIRVLSQRLICQIRDILCDYSNRCCCIFQRTFDEIRIFIIRIILRWTLKIVAIFLTTN